MRTLKKKKKESIYKCRNSRVVVNCRYASRDPSRDSRVYMPHSTTVYANKVSHQSEVTVDQLSPLFLIIDHLCI